ncbi:putative FRE ferric reductase-like transmembrane component, partial [Aureobasidium melanogenum]
MLGGPQTNTHVRRPVHSLLISLSMNGMSGLPYSVLQPVFLDLTAAGKKANRMRFFWNSMGCCGWVSRGEAKGSDDGGGDTRPLRDALLKGSKCACGSGLTRSSFSRLSAFSLSGSPAASSIINAEFLFVLAEMVESRLFAMFWKASLTLLWNTMLIGLVGVCAETNSPIRNSSLNHSSVSGRLRAQMTWTVFVTALPSLSRSIDESTIVKPPKGRKTRTMSLYSAPY